MNSKVKRIPPAAAVSGGGSGKSSGLIVLSFALGQD
jgi:hypothetical protein